MNKHNSNAGYLFNSRRIFISTFSLFALLMSGCSSDLPVPDGEAFTDGYRSFLPEAYCYSSYTDNGLKLIEYATMTNSSLCSKPNCSHRDQNCIVQRLDRMAPLISDGYAYYFSDSDAELYENENGNSDLKLGSALYCWNLKNGKQKKLLRVDGYSISAYYGWLMHGGLIYYVGNGLSRYYDENHNLLSYGNSGGEMSLCMADPVNSDTAGLCQLYDIETLKSFFPAAAQSAEAYMKGLFENKIYFNIAFVEQGEQWEGGFIYHFYVTYYDLNDGTYHGTPVDYKHIDYAAVSFLSDDYLAICRDGEASVYQSGTDEPVILKDDCFYPEAELTAFDDTVFCSGKVFDLNTREVHEAADLNPDDPTMNAKEVIARYGDDYIVRDDALNFEKIPAEKLLN